MNATIGSPKPGSDDLILKSFSQPQKNYIIEQLYPEITKALIHFVAEAVRCN